MKERIINLLGLRGDKLLVCHMDCISRNRVPVIMETITEEQETRIDNSAKYYGAIQFERKDGKIVASKDIYVYGEINFNNDEDLNLIEKFNLVDEIGGWVYSNFNYKQGNFKTIDGLAKGRFTYNPVLWFKFCHVLIGKPERIIVYRSRYGI